MYQRLWAILMNMCDTLKLVVFCVVFSFFFFILKFRWYVVADCCFWLKILFYVSKLSVNQMVSSIQRLSLKKKRVHTHITHTQAQFQLTAVCVFVLNFLFLSKRTHTQFFLSLLVCIIFEVVILRRVWATYEKKVWLHVTTCQEYK